LHTTYKKEEKIEFISIYKSRVVPKKI